MLSTFHPRLRGMYARRALLAIARECERRALPFPKHDCIGRALGISGPQVTRHLAVLLDAGTLTTRQVGRRIFVERLAPGW
jgi:DNA-binding transcriptional ArsR family regulator